MKQLLLSIFILLAGQPTLAQPQPMSDKMTTYRDACLKMLDGINQDFDKYILWDAIDLYNQVRITEFNDEDYVPIDSSVVYYELPPKIFFTPEYTDSLIIAGTLVDIDDISILRKGEDFDIQILHKGIKANGSVAYKSAGFDDCEMMVVGNLGANIKLTITDLTTGVSHEGTQENDGMVSYVIWGLPAEGSEFVFRIDNLSDDDVSIVIAAN